MRPQGLSDWFFAGGGTPATRGRPAGQGRKRDWEPVIAIAKYASSPGLQDGSDRIRGGEKSGPRLVESPVILPDLPYEVILSDDQFYEEPERLRSIRSAAKQWVIRHVAVRRALLAPSETPARRNTPDHHGEETAACGSTTLEQTQRTTRKSSDGSTRGRGERGEKNEQEFMS